MSEPTLYRRQDARHIPLDEWVDGTELCLGRHHQYEPVEPDHLVLMCEYCLCFITPEQQFDPCWNCGANRVTRYAMFKIGVDDE